MDNFAAQIRIFEASNRPVRFMHTHGYENESSDGKTNRFIVLTPPPSIIDRMDRFSRQSCTPLKITTHQSCEQRRWNL